MPSNEPFEINGNVVKLSGKALYDEVEVDTPTPYQTAPNASFDSVTPSTPRRNGSLKSNGHVRTLSRKLGAAGLNDSRFETSVYARNFSTPFKDSTLSKSVYSITRGSLSNRTLILDPLGRSEGGWKNHIEFLGACLALSWGLPNVFRLPTLAWTNNGATFVVLWLIMMTVIGFPVLFLEFSLGCFSNKGVTKIWKAVPLLKGMGYLQVWMCFLMIWDFLSISSYSFSYVAISIAKGTDFWNDCYKNDSYATSCTLSEQPNRTILLTPSENCFLDKISMATSSKLAYNGLPVLGSAVLLFLTFGITHRGFQSVGKASLISFLFSLGTMLTFLVLGSNEAGQSRGIDFAFLHPKGFDQPEVWLSALSQTLLSLHLGSGVIVNFASNTKQYGENVFRDTLIIWLSSILSGLLSLSLAFCWAGAVFPPGDSSLHHPVSFLFALFHEVSAKAYPGHERITMAFLFLLIFISGLNSVACLLHSLITVFYDVSKSSLSKWKVSLGFCLVFFILSVPTFTSEGLNLTTSLDWYSISDLSLLGVTLFTTGFMLIYGRSRLFADLNFWMNFPGQARLLQGLLWILTLVVPGLLTALLITRLAVVPLDGFGPCHDALWSVGFGWALACIGLAVIPIVAIYEVRIQIEYGFINRIKFALKSERDWGPDDPILQHRWRSNGFGIDPRNESLAEKCLEQHEKSAHEKSTRF